MDDELRFRMRMIDAGVGITYALVVLSLPWIAATWSAPQRPLVLAMLALGGLSGLVVSRLPRERIVRGPRREAFFLAWSGVQVAFIAAVAAVDGGAASPVTFGLVLTLIFAALSYPLRSVVLVCAFNLLAYLAVYVLGGELAYAPGFSHLWMFGISLTLAGAMCGWQARLQGELRSELARLSRADPLTGALNRRGFAARLDAELAGGRPFALVLLDLDGFKAVNDTHGHAAGDELLRWVVGALVGLLRGRDAVGRVGGDEFALLLPGADAEEAAAVAARVLATLRERVEACAGTASFPGDGPDGDALQRHADAALYAAKRERPGARERVSG